MAEEWLLGQGFGQTKAQDDESDTDGQQLGETEFHGESLTGGKGPGWAQSVTKTRKIGVKVDVNGFGGGIKSQRYPDGQAVSGALNRGTGHGDPIADGEDTTLDNVAPPGGHSTEKSGYGKAGRRGKR